MWGLLSKRIRWNPLSESEKVRHAFLFEYIIISDQFSNLPLLFSFFLLLNLFVKHKQLFFKTCWSWGSIYPEHEGLVLKTDGEWTYKSKLFFIRFKSFCPVFDTHIYVFIYFTVIQHNIQRCSLFVSFQFVPLGKPKHIIVFSSPS